VSPGSDPLRRSSWCTRTRRLRLTLYPRRPGTVADSSRRGRSARHSRPGKGRVDRSTLSFFPHRRWILCSFDFTAGGSHPSASKRSTEVGSSCPSSTHNQLATSPKKPGSTILPKKRFQCTRPFGVGVGVTSSFSLRDEPGLPRERSPSREPRRKPPRSGDVVTLTPLNEAVSPSIRPTRSSPWGELYRLRHTPESRRSTAKAKLRSEKGILFGDAQRVSYANRARKPDP